MSTAVMSMGALQQHRQLPAKKMVMMLSPPHGLQQAQIMQPSNGACVIVSANAYPPQSPPHFTNLDAGSAASSNNNSLKAKNNNLNKVVRVGGGGAVQKARPQPAARTSVVVSAASTTASTTTTATAASAAAAAEALRCKRRIQFSGQGGGAPAATTGGGQSLSFSAHQPASVARRNARERNRVKQVNNGFATLRSHIPPAIAAALQEQQTAEQRAEQQREQQRGRKDKEAAKKLSKVETLRMAVEYIRSLQAMLSETSENSAPAVKTENVLADSPGSGFDTDYEAALALSQYSQGGGQPLLLSLSPPCSDASSSPTPSYVSDGSAGASSTGYAAPSFQPQHHHHHHHHLVESPATPPDSTLYEPMSPEDEELLDVISWWQQTNW